MTLAHYSPWPPLLVGDHVLIRDRRTARELTVTVTATLPPLEGEGPGIRDQNGQPIRHHFYDARPITPPADAPCQAEIDDRFAEITAPSPSPTPRHR